MPVRCDHMLANSLDIRSGATTEKTRRCGTVANSGSTRQPIRGSRNSRSYCADESEAKIKIGYLCIGSWVQERMRSMLSLSGPHIIHNWFGGVGSPADSFERAS